MTEPARRQIPTLAAADDAIAALPPAPTGIQANVWTGRMTPNDEYQAWTAERDRLTAARDAALTAHRDLLCRKCDGHGRVQWRHRSGGLCYQCGGDGWTAKGRRQHTNA